MLTALVSESFLLEDITDNIVSRSELKSFVLLCQAGFEFTHFSDEKPFSVHLEHRTALPVKHSFADPAIAVTNHEIRGPMSHLTRASKY